MSWDVPSSQGLDVDGHARICRNPSAGNQKVAYDRQSHIGKLDKALDEANAKDWPIVGMKDG